MNELIEAYDDTNYATAERDKDTGTIYIALAARYGHESISLTAHEIAAFTMWLTAFTERAQQHFKEPTT